MLYRGMDTPHWDCSFDGTYVSHAIEFATLYGNFVFEIKLEDGIDLEADDDAQSVNQGFGWYIPMWMVDSVRLLTAEEVQIKLHQEQRDFAAKTARPSYLKP